MNHAMIEKKNLMCSWTHLPTTAWGWVFEIFPKIERVQIFPMKKEWVGKIWRRGILKKCGYHLLRHYPFLMLSFSLFMLCVCVCVCVCMCVCVCVCVLLNYTIYISILYIFVFHRKNLVLLHLISRCVTSKME